MMAQQAGRQARSSDAERLLNLVDRYNLYHVKTLRYKDVQGVLAWLGVKSDTFTFGHDEDTVTVLNRLVDLRKFGNVGVMGIRDKPQIEGKDRLVVHVKRDHGPGNGGSKYSSVVLFLVMRCSARAPYTRELMRLIEDVRKVLGDEQKPLFPAFACCPPQPIENISQAVFQQAHPVIDGFLPSSYNTTKPKVSTVAADNFGRRYEPLKCTATARPWSVYADVGAPRYQASEFDVEGLVTASNRVLGRGGFGVTVSITGDLVAKTSLFPDMVDWSVPFIADEFQRYAHVASQVEEIMVGVSMKHPNVLRAFGGFWCDIPGYQLGGRAVLVLERALWSLQEFMSRIGDASVVPAVELDTLRGLEYLRARTIQHRDLTYRNVLVCHQPERKPLPFAFKISDFGTSCNFSTPDHGGGNRTNMAPETLWCSNSATGSDIFSWYCVMWELHSGSPLVSYKGPEGGYCRKTYAESLSNLVGVYSPERDETFELGHMKSIDARALHAKHKDKRPTVQTIQRSLEVVGRDVADKCFVRMGPLCVTLFPQERWTPSELLSLLRYRLLSRDISDAESPSKKIPLNVRAGEYRPTDIIVADDCVPEGLAELVTARSAAGSPVTVIKPDLKVYYGIDIMRLAPDVIQPYSWYSKKVKELEDVYKCKYKRKYKCGKRKAGDGDRNDGGARRPKTAAGACAHRIRPRPEIAEATRKLDREEKTPFVPLDITERVSGSAEESLSHLNDSLRRSDNPFEILSYNGVPAVSDAHLGSGAETADASRTRGNGGDANREAAPRQSSESSEVICRGKKIDGQVDTAMAILKSRSEKEVTRFKDNVVLLSQSMTRKHPLIFTGPREGTCVCSRGGNGMFIFQYAQLFAGCEPVERWTTSDSPHSAHAFLLQIFLTLMAAAVAKVLPAHMTEWRDVLIGGGAVAFDVVPYLARNFNEPRSSLFGEECNSLVSLCTAMVARHLPDSHLHEWLRGLSPGTSASRVLTESIEWLRNYDASERKAPCLLTPQGNCFTFRDYSSDVPNWLTYEGEEEGARGRSGAKTLVFGEPKPLRGDQTAESPGGTGLSALVRNIVLRMRVKIFGTARVEVTALDCTRDLTKVTLSNAALSEVSSLDALDRWSIPPEIRDCFAHDAVSRAESKWAPVMMFTKSRRPGPVRECNVDYYRMSIFVVLLSPRGSVGSLGELFRNVTTFSVTDC